ncbi:hypothetical protein [Massilia alkalitolerans]|uniref:hypothetical protein n=1 Tax=Massilia alkalitolerans TaxID=286638 RepID=UPI000413AB8A|nr:hypothetical protein [Massilia alkalitolerans]
MTQRRFSPALLAMLCATLAAAQPAAASDFLDKLAKQVVGDTVQAAARHATAKAAAAATPAAPAARPAHVRAGAREQRMRLENGEPFHADYIIDYWSRPDAVTRGSTPELDAPGWIMPVPSKFGASKKGADYALLQRRLERIIARVMAHPALVGIRGASLTWSADFGYDGGKRPLVANISMLARPISLDDPKTKRYPDGSFHTPGEGPVLEITVNNPEEIGSRRSSGSYKGMTVLRHGYMFVIPNTDRPLLVGPADDTQVNPDLLDDARPRSDIQFMTVYVGAFIPSELHLVQKRIDPVGNAGRLIGVLYNIDWHAVLEEASALQ